MKIDWRREIAIGAARRIGERHANTIAFLAVARRAAPALLALATVGAVAYVLSQATAVAFTSTLILDAIVSLVVVVLGVVAYRRLSLSHGWYLGVAGATAALLAVLSLSLATSTLIVWLAT